MVEAEDEAEEAQGMDENVGGARSFGRVRLQVRFGAMSAGFCVYSEVPRLVLALL